MSIILEVSGESNVSDEDWQGGKREVMEIEKRDPWGEGEREKAMNKLLSGRARNLPLNSSTKTNPPPEESDGEVMEQFVDELKEEHLKIKEIK